MQQVWTFIAAKNKRKETQKIKFKVLSVPFFFFYLFHSFKDL